MKHLKRQNCHHGKPLTYKGRKKQKEKEKIEIQNNQKEKNSNNSPYVSITILTVNGLNSPIKRHKGAGWLDLKKNTKKKRDPTRCCLHETHFNQKDTDRLQVKGWKMIFQESRNQNKVGKAIFISDKIDVKSKMVT